MTNDTSSVTGKCDVEALQQEVDQFKSDNVKGFVLISFHSGETDNDAETRLAFSAADDITMEALFDAAIFAIDAVGSDEGTFELIEEESDETVH